MKKIFAAMLAMIMTLSLCGCNVSINQPEDRIDEFFEAVIDKNEDVLIIYTENKDINALLHCTGSEEQLNRIHENLVKNLSYEIVHVKMNEDETAATAVVSITKSDFSNVLDNYKKAAIKYMTDNIYKDDVTKEVMTEKCLSLYADEIENTAASTDGLVTAEVTIELMINDYHEWDMVMTDELSKATIGNLTFPE